MTDVRTDMKRRLMVALGIAALFIGGCSSSDNSAPNTGGAAPAAAPDRKEGTELQAKAPEGVTATTGPVEGRALIYRGDITVRVEDVEIAADKVEALASTLGGHVSSQKRTTGTRNAQASMTLRIPTRSFDSALDQVGALGKEESRGSNTEDVTEAVVDLDTRIASQKANLEATRKLYDRAATFADITALRREVAQAETELAVLEAKKRRLDDLVALSTINVSLAGPNTELPDEDIPGFMGGLKAGWNAFITAVRVLLVVVGWLLPFAIAIAIPIVALVWLSRIRKRRRPPLVAAAAVPSAFTAYPPAEPPSEGSGSER